MNASSPPRLAEKRLLDRLVEIEALSFSEFRISRRQFRYHLHHPRNRLFVHDAPDVPCAGYILLQVHRRSARIYSLAVHPAMVGRGIGRRLCELAEAHAITIGIPLLYLEMKCGNEPARRLYEAMGLRVTRRLPEYYGPGSPGVRMAKPLRPVNQSPQPAKKAPPGTRR